MVYRCDIDGIWYSGIVGIYYIYIWYNEYNWYDGYNDTPGIIGII